MKRRLAILTAALLCSLPAEAATIRVPADYATIGQAANAAGNGDTLLVACGTYFEHDINLPGACVLRGEGEGADCVVIDAQQLGRCVIASSLGIVLEKLTLRGGVGGTRGGGFYNTGGSVLRDVTIENCSASSQGGGAYCGSVSFRNLVLVGNSANYGGGLYAQDYGYTQELPAPSTGLLAIGNEALEGSAIYIQTCSWYWHAQLEGLTIVGNRSAAGGALTMGAMDGEWPNWLSIKRSIFAGNEGYALSCPSSWDDFYLFSAPAGSDWDAFVSMSCFWENTLGDFGGSLDNLTGSYGNIFTDPGFCTPELGDYSLREDSPCLPAGNLSRVTMGAIAAPCVLTSVADGGGLPARPGRIANVPNPFNPSTEIRFTLTGPQRVSLRVYDIAGRCVATLLDRAPLAAGAQAIAWNGRDAAGRALPSGIYLYRLEAGELKATQKMTLLK